MAHSAENPAAIGLDYTGGLFLHGMAESIIGHQEKPVLLALFGQGKSGPMRERVRIIGPMRAVR